MTYRQHYGKESNTKNEHGIRNGMVLGPCSTPCMYGYIYIYIYVCILFFSVYSHIFYLQDPCLSGLPDNIDRSSDLFAKKGELGQSNKAQLSK